MPEQPTEPSRESASIRLQELAQRLRSADHLEPEAQRELANLMDELAKILGTTAPATPETNHLADSAAHLAHALEQRRPGVLESAKQRLEEAALRAEEKAPLATGIVHRLLEALADLGI